MDELAFKRHLRDLAHGHHHPEEHDWGTAPAVARTKDTPKRPRAKASQPKSKASKKRQPH